MRFFLAPALPSELPRRRQSARLAILVLGAYLFTANISAYAQATGAITGTVTDEVTGLPLSLSLTLLNQSGSPVAFATSDETGRYTFESLTPESYSVRVYPTFSPSSGYLGELYDDVLCDLACDVTSGTPIVVTAGMTTGGIDFALAKPSTGCTFSASPSTASFGPDGGPGSFTITGSDAGCRWIWGGGTAITLPSPFSGTGQTTVTYTMYAQPLGAPARTGTWSFVAYDGTDSPVVATHTITQDAGRPLCVDPISPSEATIGPDGGTFSFDVVAASGCSWSATSAHFHLTIEDGEGVGNGNVTYSVAPNTLGHSPTMRIDILQDGAFTGLAFNVTQEEAPFTLAPRVLHFGALDTGGTIGVTSAAQHMSVTQTGTGDEAWTATTAESWLVLSPAAGSGSGMVTVSIVDTDPAILNCPSVSFSARTCFGEISVTMASALLSPKRIEVTLKVYTGPPPILGFWDLPVDGATVNGSIAVSGWALDGVETDRVELWRDPFTGEAPYMGAGPGDGKVFVGNATFIEGARPDV